MTDIEAEVRGILGRANDIQDVTWWCSLYTAEPDALMLYAERDEDPLIFHGSRAAGYLFLCSPAYIRLPRTFDQAHFELVPREAAGDLCPVPEYCAPDRYVISVQARQGVFCVVCKSVFIRIPPPSAVSERGGSNPER